jgi:hypothetical protein
MLEYEGTQLYDPELYPTGEQVGFAITHFVKTRLENDWRIEKLRSSRRTTPESMHYSGSLEVCKGGENEPE